MDVTFHKSKPLFPKLHHQEGGILKKDEFWNEPSPQPLTLSLPSLPNIDEPIMSQLEQQ